MTVRLLITGGTFDKEYNELTGALFFKDTHVPEILRAGRCHLDVDVRTLMMMDSLDMTEVEREIIVENCRRCRRDRIVVTHGTDSMELTARALGQAIRDRTIVLTGAMVPYMVTSSDAVFNFGCAVTAAQLSPPGVWIAMNGRVFRWDAVRKNRDLGVFEPKEEP